MADFVAVVTLAWWSIRPLVRFSLCCVSLGQSITPRWSTGSVARVHRYWGVIHPLWSVGRSYLSRSKSPVWLVSSWHLGRVGAESSEVRCVLCDRIDQLHRFDDCDESSFHRLVGDWYWGREDLV